MHAHAFDFVAQALQFLEPWPRRVIEIGARDVNGSIRPLFVGADYLGVDVAPGLGVDVVADGARVTLADLGASQSRDVTTYLEADGTPAAIAGRWHVEGVDVVVCCEVLEHAVDWPGIVRNGATLLRPGGALIVTCAGPGRAPHSAVDGGALRDGEHYGNVPAGELEGAALAAGVRALHVVERADRGDVYFVGVRDA